MYVVLGGRYGGQCPCMLFSVVVTEDSVRVCCSRWSLRRTVSVYVVLGGRYVGQCPCMLFSVVVTEDSVRVCYWSWWTQMSVFLSSIVVTEENVLALCCAILYYDIIESGVNVVTTNYLASSHVYGQ